MASIITELTSKARVKEQLGITVIDDDAALQRLIDRASMWFEARTNRRFLNQEYIELHDGGEKNIYLDNLPVTVVTLVERNDGTEDTPDFKAVATNDFHVYLGKRGFIQFFGVRIPFNFGRSHPHQHTGGTNRTTVGQENYRITYKGGFLIDFAFTNDDTKHTLPLDIEDFVIRLVSRRFNMRKADGVSSEGVEGANITWANPTQEQLSFEDRKVIQTYAKKTQHYN